MPKQNADRHTFAQSWRASLIFLHILWGLWLLVWTGALRHHGGARVRRAQQRWFQRLLHVLDIQVNVTRSAVSAMGQTQPPQAGTLYIANHISWVDIPLIGSQLDTHFLSKAEVRSWPLIGRLAEATGTLFIQRGSGDSKRVAEQMADYLREGYSVLFFPEGTTSPGETVQAFHPRLFQLTNHVEVEICPLSIRYRGHSSQHAHSPVAFIEDDEFTSHLWQLLGHRKLSAELHIHPPVRRAPEEDVSALTKNLQAIVASAITPTPNPNTSTLSLDGSNHGVPMDAVTSARDWPQRA